MQKVVIQNDQVHDGAFPADLNARSHLPPLSSEYCSTGEYSVSIEPWVNECRIHCATVSVCACVCAFIQHANSRRANMLMRCVAYSAHLYWLTCRNFASTAPESNGGQTHTHTQRLAIKSTMREWRLYGPLLCVCQTTMWSGCVWVRNVHLMYCRLIDICTIDIFDCMYIRCAQRIESIAIDRVNQAPWTLHYYEHNWKKMNSYVRKIINWFITYRIVQLHIYFLNIFISGISTLVTQENTQFAHTCACNVYYW